MRLPLHNKLNIAEVSKIASYLTANENNISQLSDILGELCHVITAKNDPEKIRKLFTEIKENGHLATTISQEAYNLDDYEVDIYNFINGCYKHRETQKTGETTHVGRLYQRKNQAGQHEYEVLIP